MDNEEMDLIYFGITHPEGMDKDAVIANAKKAITDNGYMVGEIDEVNEDGDKILSITFQVSPDLSTELEEEGEMAFDHGGVYVEAEWPY